jgi:hypothetical protein
MARPIRNELTKLTKLFKKNTFSRYNNDLRLKLTGKNVRRSPRRVLGTFNLFGLCIIKNTYFDPILGVSIKMYLFPGFEI